MKNKNILTKSDIDYLLDLYKSSNNVKSNIDELKGSEINYSLLSIEQFLIEVGPTSKYIKSLLKKKTV